MKILTGAVAIFALISPSVASANWYARCESSDGLCEAAACGTTPDDAKQRCYSKCPFDPGLLSLGTASCSPGILSSETSKTPSKQDTFQIK
jgi:hypothetical protein